MPSPMSRAPARSFVLPGDVYRVQRRPGHPQLVVNDGYEGIAVVDPWDGDVVARVPFSPAFHRAGSVDAWIFRADGDAVLVLNEEDAAACILSLAGGAPRDLAVPETLALPSLAALWNGDVLWATSGKYMQSFRVETAAANPEFSARSSIAARAAETSWRTALDAVRLFQCNVLRVEMDLARMVFYNYTAQPPHLGVVDWGTRTVRAHPCAAQPARAAASERGIVVMGEIVAGLVDADGAMETICEAPEGMRFLDVAVLPADSGRAETLVVLARPENGTLESHFLLFELSEP